MQKKINLEKLVDSVDTIWTPTIFYFKGSIKSADGGINYADDFDGNGYGVNKETIENLDLNLNEILENENPILKLCEESLDKDLKLFFRLGIFEVDSGEYWINDNAHVELDSEIASYENGGFGVFVNNDLTWDYGYFEEFLITCFSGSTEFGYVSDDERDLVAVAIKKEIDEMDIFQ